MKKKFVLSIGDDGAILTLVEKNIVVKRLFAIDSSLSHTKQMSELLKNNPNVSISILIDTIEQNYNIQTLPAVSAFNIGKLVNKRLERDFSNTDLKGAVSLGKEEHGRKDWIYMLASSPLSVKISDWIDYVLSFSNPLSAIYLLPLEMERFIKRVNKSVHKNSTPEDWHLFVTHNKTGGFRQVVVRKQKVIFTRLIRFGNDTLPDIVAGNVEQEIINTIDYLTRLSFAESDKIIITAIVPSDIKTSLQSTVIRNEKIHLYTPSEIEKEIGISNPLAIEDKFADFAIAANFAREKPILKLENKKTRKVTNYQNCYKAVVASSILFIVSLLIVSTFVSIKSFSANKKVSKLKDEKAQVETEWKNANNDSKGNFEEVTKIADSVKMYRLIKSDNSKPFHILKNLFDAQESFAYTNSFLWSYSESVKNKDKGEEKLKLSMKFYKTGSGPEDLFLNFDNFMVNLNSNFPDYVVKSSKLPEQITFGTNADIINLQISIETDKKDS